MARHARAVSANRMMVVAIAVVTLLFVLMVGKAFSGNGKVVAEPLPALVTNEQAVNLANRDSDGDGRPDWEEVLWNTDPNNPDSDGDGTPDGDEVVESTHRTEPDLALAIAGTDSAPSTFTEAAAQELLGTYAETAATGRLRAGVGNNMVAAALLAAADRIPQYRQFTADMVNTVTANDTTRSAYIEALWDTLEEGSVDAPGEYNAMYRAVTEGMNAGLEDFRATYEVYQHTIDTLKNMRVPTDAVSSHVALVSALQEHVQAIGLLVLIDEDPMMGTLGYTKMNQTSPAFYAALQEHLLYRVEHTNTGTAASDTTLQGQPAESEAVQDAITDSQGAR